MRHITKRLEPTSWTKLRRKPPAKWEDIPLEVKAELKAALMVEQDGLCAYCGAWIGGDRPSHIDHFVPRKVNPGQTFVYDNLHGSCNGGQGKHCGHARGHVYDPAFVSPRDPVCQRLFAFAADGGLDAHDGQLQTAGARATIAAFHLDEDPGLRRERKKAYETVSQVRHWGLPPEQVRLALQDLQSQYATPANGQLKAFAFVYLYFIDEALRDLDL